MKGTLYNVLFAVVYPFLLPGFLVRMLRRGGYAARMGDRFALYPAGLFGRDRPLFDRHARQSNNRTIEQSNNAYVWIHAVSVGEVQVAGQLMREWRKAEPGVRFCFSTTSSTGWKMAEKEVAEKDVLIYNPLDFPNFVKSALRTVRPRAIVLTESEIWPNFIWQAKKMRVPLFLINARVSDRSAPRYKAAKWFFGDVLSCFTRIFAQSDLDKARLVAAGAPEEKVEVTGSFKFDVAHRNEAKEQELREWIFGSNRVGVGSDRVGVGSDSVRCDAKDASKTLGDANKTLSDASKTIRDAKAANKTLSDPKILLGGSTWPGEDEVLLKIYKRLLDEQSSTRSHNVSSDALAKGGQAIEQSNNPNNRTILVLAPRHFEKADAVEANIRKAGFACVRRSREVEKRGGGGQRCEDSTVHLHLSSPPVYLADTTGELMGLYGIADVVFVGKSLCAHGSQNMIEPCLCGKPTFVGPYTENFRPVMSDLLAADAIVQVKDAEELEEGIVEVFKSLTSGEDAASPKDAASPTAPASPLGERAKAAVERRLGVVAKCVDEIRRAL